MKMILTIKKNDLKSTSLNHLNYFQNYFEQKKKKRFVKFNSIKTNIIQQ